MHAQLNIRQIPAGRMDEVLQIYRDSTLPAVRSHQGFKRALILADRNASKIIAIALFETEADLTARTRTTFIDPIAGAPTSERYEVSAYDMPEPESGQAAYARVNYREIPLDRMDEAIRTYRDKTLPEVRSQNGSQGALVLADRSNGKIIAIALWDTEANMNASTPPGYVDAISGGPPVRETYEVTAEA